MRRANFATKIFYSTQEELAKVSRDDVLKAFEGEAQTQNRILWHVQHEDIRKEPITKIIVTDLSMFDTRSQARKALMENRLWMNNEKLKDQKQKFTATNILKAGSFTTFLYGTTARIMMVNRKKG